MHIYRHNKSVTHTLLQDKVDVNRYITTWGYKFVVAKVLLKTQTSNINRHSNTWVELYEEW